MSTLEGHFCWEDCDEGPLGCVCGNDCKPTAEPTDVEELARLPRVARLAKFNDLMGWSRDESETRVYPTASEDEYFARAVLVSDWLKKRDARVAADALKAQVKAMRGYTLNFATAGDLHTQMMYLLERDASLAEFEAVRVRKDGEQSND